MNAERKTDAIHAVESSDWDTLREMGWVDVFNAILHRFHRFGRQTALTGTESLAWLHVLGDRDAASVLAAIDLWAGDGNAQAPKPADILAMLTHKNERYGPDTETRLRLDNNPATLQLVAAQLAAGEHICECRPAPATLVQAANGILFCPDCAGIEQGQADAAEEQHHPTPPSEMVAIHDLSAVLRLKKVRQVRAARAIEERKTA